VLNLKTSAVVPCIVVGDDLKWTCVGWQCDFQRNVKIRFLPVCVVKTIDNMMTVPMPTCELLQRVIILWRTKSFLILYWCDVDLSTVSVVRIYFFLTIQQRLYIITIIVYYLKIILYREKILFSFDQTVRVPKRVTLKSTMTLLL